MVEIRFRRLEHGASVELPQYATPGAAGMDLRACLERALAIDPGRVALVPTGLAIEVPSGFEAQIRPRSGLALKHTVMVVNSPGTIDSDYRGEIKIILGNFGQERFVVEHGDRIAQIVIAAVTQARIIEVENLSETARASGGFGSTGKA